MELLKLVTDDGGGFPTTFTKHPINMRTKYQREQEAKTALAIAVIFRQLRGHNKPRTIQELASWHREQADSLTASMLR